MKRLYVIIGLVLLKILFTVGLASSSEVEGNFSQYPGFAEYFAAFPPRETLPSAQEQMLLQRHRPRLFLPSPHPGLISFYDDYIAQGHLKNASGDILATPVTQALLNHYGENPGVLFEHVPDRQQAPSPVVLGRVDYSEQILEGNPAPRFTLLTYHAVFRTSGIVAGLSWWQSLALGTVGDLDDWHQLDHYTAATLVLDAAQRPVAIMLQQHNYLRTYLYGEALPVPVDGRPLVDVATRSNELYPHQPGRVRRRAVAFLEPKSFRYMLGAGPKPWMTADDITDPQREADYALGFLPPSDAFYTFKGTLGKRRRLPGRSGPPGAEYNTLPALKPRHLQLFAGYWRPGHAGDIKRLDAALTTPTYWQAFADLQRPVFQANLGCVMEPGQDCHFQ